MEMSLLTEHLVSLLNKQSKPSVEYDLVQRLCETPYRSSLNFESEIRCTMRLCSTNAFFLRDLEMLRRRVIGNVYEDE